MRIGLVVCLAMATSRAVAQDAPGTSPYQVDVRAGIEALVATNFTAAIASFRRAIGRDADQAAAHCHLGDAMKMQERWSAALESYETCARVARQGHEDVYEARGLLGSVLVHLRIEGNQMQAREALQALIRFADANVTIVVPVVPRDMLQSLDQIIELDAVSAEVRQRREARAAAAR